VPLVVTDRGIAVTQSPLTQLPPLISAGAYYAYNASTGAPLWGPLLFGPVANSNVQLFASGDAVFALVYFIAQDINQLIKINTLTGTLVGVVSPVARSSLPLLLRRTGAASDVLVVLLGNGSADAAVLHTADPTANVTYARARLRPGSCSGLSLGQTAGLSTYSGVSTGVPYLDGSGFACSCPALGGSAGGGFSGGAAVCTVTVPADDAGVTTGPQWTVAGNYTAAFPPYALVTLVSTEQCTGSIIHNPSSTMGMDGCRGWPSRRGRGTALALW
jgi:hypothetical protein